MAVIEIVPGFDGMGWDLVVDDRRYGFWTYKQAKDVMESGTWSNFRHYTERDYEQFLS